MFNFIKLLTLLFILSFLYGCLPAVKTNTRIITAVSGKHGEIFPSGDVELMKGLDRSFVFVPEEGYVVDDVKVNGESQGSIYSFAFNDIQVNHTISVTFTSKYKEVFSRSHKPTQEANKNHNKEKKPEKQVKLKDKKPVKKQAKKKEIIVKSISNISKPIVDKDSLSNYSRKSNPLTIAVLDKITSNPQKKGRDIIYEADQRDIGYGDFITDMVMVLTNRNGDKVSRYMKYKNLEMEEDGDKSLVIFNRPVDIKGTSLLTHSHKTGSDDQWLYLPSIKRVKRISSSNKSGAFMGSEFAYEDLSSQEVDKYDYKWLKDETCGPKKCFVVEAIPRDKKSGYSKQIRWVDKKHLTTQKIEYFDLKNTLLKTLSLSDYRMYLSQYWRASEYNMVNHQTGKKTQLLWKNYKFRVGINEKDLSKSGIKG